MSGRSTTSQEEHVIDHPAAGDRTFRLLIAVALVALGAAPARAWGPLVHQRVTSEAIDTLPKGLKPFYKAHRLEMPSLAVDAPPPEDESTERRFTLDRFLPFPFSDLPRTEAALKAKYGDDYSRIIKLYFEEIASTGLPKAQPLPPASASPAK